MKIISGSTNPDLAASIAQLLDLDQIPVKISNFKNGEKRVLITEEVRGENIIFVQDLSNPTKQPIMELLLITDALERMGARHISLVMPWMGYSLQDKVFQDGEPISAKVIADLISNSYIKRVFLLDLHNSSTPGFFSIPTEHITAMPLFADYIRTKIGTKNLIIASPDFGGLKRSRVLANLLKVDLVNIDKHRDLVDGKVTANALNGGEVKGKTVVVFDDCIVSGSTVIEAAKFLKKMGAKEVHFMVTHGPLVNNSLKELQTSEADSIVVTNSIAHPKLPKKFKILDTGHLFSAVLQNWV